MTRADPQDVHRVLTANVLSSGDLSANSVQVLERNNLVALYEDDPEAGLAALHGGLAQNMNPFRLLGLAELSFLYAQNSGKREHRRGVRIRVSVPGGRQPSAKPARPWSQACRGSL